MNLFEVMPEQETTQSEKPRVELPHSPFTFAPLVGNYKKGDRLKIRQKEENEYFDELEKDALSPFIGKVGQFIEVAHGTKRSGLRLDMGKHGIHVFNEDEIIQL